MAGEVWSSKNSDLDISIYDAIYRVDYPISDIWIGWRNVRYGIGDPGSLLVDEGFRRPEVTGTKRLGKRNV